MVDAVIADEAALIVRDKYTGDVLDSLTQDTEESISEVIESSTSSVVSAGAIPRHQRRSILNGAAALLQDRAEKAAALIVSESGKTIRQARKEVSRAVNTLSLSAAEAVRNAGEVVPFDSFPGGENKQGWFTREPLGLIVAITPYNDALNLVAHKIGPAIAAGNAVILKPSHYTPLIAKFLVDLLLEAGLPDGVVTIVQGDRRVTQALVTSKHVRMVSFTGGFVAGEAIAAKAGIKRMSMELGGNAPVLVFDDADLDGAVEACVSGAFWAAGQNCIGVQRILVQRGLYDSFVLGFVAASSRLVTGDPRDESTDVGPMISEAAVDEALLKISDAVERGAEVLLGGERYGNVLSPTVLVGATPSCRLWTEEAFAPIVMVEPFDDEASAIALANDSDFALQAGIFTQDITRALRVAQAIEAGGVMINDSSDYRLDAMPFGGSKYGSMGREGVRFTYEDMTQLKVVAISR